MNVRSRVLGEGNAETLDSMWMVGIARALARRYEEVEAIIDRRWRGRRRCWGLSIQTRLISVHGLARVLT
jgi:membrane glycosyltransferase